jgi:NDP-sugar pyrophosphorylase family protein
VIGADRLGLRIDYSYDGPSPIGTLGAVRKAAPLLGERFLVLYGDTYLRLDHADAATRWGVSGCSGLMTVLRNKGRWDTSNAELRDNGRVLYDKRAPTTTMQWIDYGLGGLRRAALDQVPGYVSDLAELYHALSLRGELFGYDVTERFYEIGTPAALIEADAFLRSLGRGACYDTSHRRALR